LRSVVEQVARGDGRRTLILISDGFLLAPGKAPFTLLEGYFPEFRSTRALEGMQDSFADGREYYMLAYVPTNEAQDGKFRVIKVEVRDNSALVSAKRGYWATPQ
jgi:hypothetical protein